MYKRQKEWRPEWGGALFWCPRSAYVPPQFNSLILFNIGQDSAHFVTTVSPDAQGKRLTINGWWTGPDPTDKRHARTFKCIDDESVSIEIY